MSPQFVDLNADEMLDIVAGTFDGSPHVAYGTPEGWRQPEQILDKNGERIVMNAYWDFDKKQWVDTKRCNPKGVELPEGHLTSAWAADHDGDGDLDLLLGDHRHGHVLLRINEGSADKPSFAAQNQVIHAGGAPLVVAGTVTTLRLFDWNGDDRLDLICGSMGDSYGAAPGGGVFLYLNTGTNAAPVYANATVLIEASKKGVSEPTRPDSGLHMDVADADGDGDLDLVVGGYSHWTPPAPTLTEEQTQRVAAIRSRLDELTKSAQAFSARFLKETEGLDKEAKEEKRQELLKATEAERGRESKERAALQLELEPLVSDPKRISYVWFYENLKVGGGSPPAHNK